MRGSSTIRILSAWPDNICELTSLDDDIRMELNRGFPTDAIRKLLICAREQNKTRMAII